MSLQRGAISALSGLLEVAREVVSRPVRLWLADAESGGTFIAHDLTGGGSAAPQSGPAGRSRHAPLR